MSRMLAFTGVLVAILAFAAAASASHPLAPQGEIGGPPSGPVFVAKPRTTPIVIGAGQTAIGPIEIVGYRSRFGLCIEHTSLTGAGGGCGEPSDLKGSIDVSSIIFAGGRGGETLPDGPIATDVASVRIRVKRRAKAASAVLAIPGPALLAHMNRSEPFGYFIAGLKGCVPSRRMTAIARDAAGVLLGKARFRQPGDKDDCKDRLRLP